MLSINWGSENFEIVYGFDFVIDGLGVDLLWFILLFSQYIFDLFELGLGGLLIVDCLQEVIGYDLVVIDVMFKLFLFILFGFIQGFGFFNLSCFGLLLDWVFGVGIFMLIKYNDIRRSGEY